MKDHSKDAWIDIIKQITSEKHPKKATAINTTDNLEMIEEGLRQPPIDINRTIHIKTDSERKLIKRMKTTVFNKTSLNGKQVKYTSTNTHGVLRIYVKNTGTKEPTPDKHRMSKYFKTTYSFKNVHSNEIPYFIDLLKYRYHLIITKAIHNNTNLKLK